MNLLPKQDENYWVLQTKVSQWSASAQLEEGQKKKETEDKSKLKEEKKGPGIKTKPGQKKDTTAELPAQFDPVFVEEGWYQWWEAKKFFHADEQKVLSNEKKPYVMMIPPPNVTGALHLGHGLMLAIEDLISRWK